MRVIAHLDMDAFFAAVEERDHPRLRGKPIVVGGDPEEGRGRGVVATANYAARKYGIHSAMPISEAWRLAETGRAQGGQATVFMSGNYAEYEKAASRVMTIVHSYSADVERASIDEAYFDLSASGDFDAARKIALEIKRRVTKEEKLTASIGLGPNKMIAKIASDMEKPDGLTVVSGKRVMDFLKPLSIRKIPGIGPKSEIQLASLGIKTISDLQELSRESLTEMLGKWGREVYDRARGLDATPLISSWTAKSIGENETFRSDTLDPTFLAAKLETMANNVFSSLKQDGFKSFRTVVLTVRFADFTTKTRSRTFKDPVSDYVTLAFQGLQLLMPFLDARENPSRQPLRLLGLRVEKLD